MYSYKSSDKASSKEQSEISGDLSSSEEVIQLKSETSGDLSSSKEEIQSKSLIKWTSSEQKKALDRQLENAKSVLSEK